MMRARASLLFMVLLQVQTNRPDRIIFKLQAEEVSQDTHLESHHLWYTNRPDHVRVASGWVTPVPCVCLRATRIRDGSDHCSKFMFTGNNRRLITETTQSAMYHGALGQVLQASHAHGQFCYCATAAETRRHLLATGGCIR